MAKTLLNKLLRSAQTTSNTHLSSVTNSWCEVSPSDCPWPRRRRTNSSEAPEETSSSTHTPSVRSGQCSVNCRAIRLTLARTCLRTSLPQVISSLTSDTRSVSSPRHNHRPRWRRCARLSSQRPCSSAHPSRLCLNISQGAVELTRKATEVRRTSMHLEQLVVCDARVVTWRAGGVRTAIHIMAVRGAR